MNPERLTRHALRALIQRDEPYPDLDFCSACHEHTEFRFDDGEWLSACCDAYPTPTDPPDYRE